MVVVRATPWRSYSSVRMICLAGDRPSPPYSFGQPGQSQPFSASLKYQGLSSDQCSRFGGCEFFGQAVQEGAHHLAEMLVVQRLQLGGRGNADGVHRSGSL